LFFPLREVLKLQSQGWKTWKLCQENLLRTSRHVVYFTFTYTWSKLQCFFWYLTLILITQIW
jgi:hypothetical protein